jgi:hypothetical protein
MGKQQQREKLYENLSASLTLLETDVPEGWFLTIVAAKCNHEKILDEFLITNGQPHQMLAAIRLAKSNLEDQIQNGIDNQRKS